MCGINGFTFRDDALIAAMNDAIAHRGPDDAGVLKGERVTLGHRRLSVIDLSPAGHQPMCDASGDYAIVYNGEIYDFAALRAELEALGHVFRSKTDTEVILHAYKQYGVECFRRFNGMWGLCIYDRKAQKLVLSRDPLGEKPLYYSQRGDELVFSSSLKALLVHGVPRDIDPAAIDFYLTLGYIPSPLTFYAGIRKLEAGHTLTYDLSRRSCAVAAYYERPAYAPSRDVPALVEEGRALLDDATRIRMVADVKVGAFLSGGLDSTAVVATMAKFTDVARLHTFSVGFEGAYDESRYMQIASRAIGSVHHQHAFDERDFERVLGVIHDHFDEPFADYSNFPTYHVAELARREVTVCLSGDGGDEIFGGYTLHQVAAQLELITRVPRRVRAALHALLPTLRSMSRLALLKQALALSLGRPERMLADLATHLVYKPQRFQDWSAQRLAECMQRAGLTEGVIRYDLFYNTLADNFLVKTDRASMAHALEVRSPFLDPRFVALSARIPTAHKATAWRRKILMREMIAGLVPEPIRRRGKAGFEPPLREWIARPVHLALARKTATRLHERGVLDRTWHEFFSDSVLHSREMVHRIYTIRLFLLGSYWERWLGAL